MAILTRIAGQKRRLFQTPKTAGIRKKFLRIPARHMATHAFRIVFSGRIDLGQRVGGVGMLGITPYLPSGRMALLAARGAGELSRQRITFFGARMRHGPQPETIPAKLLELILVGD